MGSGANANDGIVYMARQIHYIKSSREKWPAKILQTFKSRKIPVMAVENVTKLNQSHCSRIEFINDDRKRSKEILRADISRKKKMLDDLQAKRDKMLDSFEAQLSQMRNERLLYQQNVSSFVEFPAKFLRVSKVTTQPLYDSKQQNCTEAKLIFGLDSTFRYLRQVDLHKSTPRK